MLDKYPCWAMLDCSRALGSMGALYQEAWQNLRRGPCVRSIRGLGSADLADVSVRLAEQVEANIGMAMVYALVAAAQDWLREKVLHQCRTAVHAHCRLLCYTSVDCDRLCDQQCIRMPGLFTRPSGCSIWEVFWGQYDMQIQSKGGMQAAAGQEVPVDPAAARKAADDAEERRLAEIRSHGTMVTPQTFAEWKQRFDAETALQRSRLQGKPAS